MMSAWTRLSKEVSYAFSDAYGNWVLGDDAGKAARLVFVLRPRRTGKGDALNLGMTFLEVNGRAYVKTVDRGSEADKAGVLPRDSIQFAAVIKQDLFLGEELSEDPDASAIQYALDCESKGMRISYAELRRVLKEGTNVRNVFTSPTPDGDNSQWKGPPIPSTINVCAPDEEEFQVRPMSPFRGDNPNPVVFVFRRTRQRQSSSAVGVLPSFRLDDECDFASSLIRRLAPTTDMEVPPPDTWEELVHDGTDWLLGNGSILPPMGGGGQAENTTATRQGDEEVDSGIPLDEYEKERTTKLARLRSRMAAEALKVDHTDDIEAATIRGMVQKAVGLAFVRASKVVMGVSVHGGSGVVIARLSDGTWSAPSAIGTWGLGLGIQFGLEVAEYIFILQTQESLDHFRRGGSFTIGGNVGAAVAGMGREAYGAASVGPMCTQAASPKDDEYNDDDSEDELRRGQSVNIAPIVAYAKSQGLYIGVSLEGSRIFTRGDINARAYKFTAGRDVSAYEILAGKVPTPPEAEDLYASLHSVEFTHEMSCLPRPPEVLRAGGSNPWNYDQTVSSRPSSNPFTFLSDMTAEESEECALFETEFKNFMYGGVSVQKLIPNSESRSGKTRKERRTLWLMLPETGSLRLGFVSKLSDGEGTFSNQISTQRARQSSDFSLVGEDQATVASEEVTLDSALMTEKETNTGHIRTGHVHLSNKHSVALTDVTLLTQDPQVPIRFNSEADQTEHLRVISIEDVAGTSLLFVANNFREAELLVCGLKLLLERETARLSVRGGVPITALGGRAGEGVMSPDAARGFREITPVSVAKTLKKNKNSRSRSKQRRIVSGYSSSEAEDDESQATADDSIGLQAHHSVPEGRKSWGLVPGRDFMREQAGQASPTVVDASAEAVTKEGIPRYTHGHSLMRDVAVDVVLPLPLSLCRVLLLDSTSPVITTWEQDRGDLNFDRTNWTFPPATPRELERHSSEHQLIATGSMMGAHRTTTFDRIRNGSIVRLSETQIVDGDDTRKIAYTVSERLPRRGFSIKIRVILRALRENLSSCNVTAEIRPVGKNMSNQTAVHKAFLLVLNEIKSRYGVEGHGLMNGLMNYVNNLPSSEAVSANPIGQMGENTNGSNDISRPFPRTEPSQLSDHGIGSDKGSSSWTRGTQPEKQVSGLVSFEDMLKKKATQPRIAIC
mmetsp:Transcript_16303/g.22980  ORF Transcript_16303/g.22980 Transcript_16303/m.22980 type:complete len:1179 (-) Transcript_16303:1060-4596(-)